jgi:hypothetical protein
MTTNTNQPDRHDGAVCAPCGGCGETDSSKRCLGCTHDFGDDASVWVRAKQPDRAPLGAEGVGVRQHDPIKALAEKWESEIRDYDYHSRTSDPEDWMAGHRECLEELRAALSARPSDGGQGGDSVLRVAALALVERLAVVHADYRYAGVWQCAQNHIGQYAGPTYTDELRALEDALFNSTAPTPSPAPLDSAQGEAVAYMDEAGERVILAKTRDNESLGPRSARAAYTVPLYLHPAPQHQNSIPAGIVTKGCSAGGGDNSSDTGELRA